MTRRLFGLVVRLGGIGACLGSVASSARAGPTLPNVDVVVVGGAERAESVSTRVESWFRGQGIRAQTHLAGEVDRGAILAPVARSGVRVWIVVSHPTAAHLYFVVQEQPGQTPRYLVSDLALDNGLDELGTEQLGQVVYLSATALWAGNVESSRQDVEAELRLTPSAEPPRPSPARPSESRTLVQIGAEYKARFGGDEGVTQLVGPHFDVLRRTGIYDFGGRLRAGVFLPHTITNGGIEVDLHGVSLALGGLASHRVTRRARLVAEAGLGIDFVRYAAGSIDDPRLRPSSGGLDARPMGYLRAGVSAELGSLFAVNIAALVDVELLRTHYDISESGRRTAIVTPWIVQPGVAAGVSW